MFDFSFSEILIIAVVAVIVLDPRHLPGVARSAGQWMGRARRFMNKMKEDLHILKDFDYDSALDLVESAYQYFLDKHSFPLKKLTYNVRTPFSAIYKYLSGNPAKQIEYLDTLKVSPEVKNALKTKLYLIYAQNY
jgi:Tat protein translocase TatB subunit